MANVLQLAAQLLALHGRYALVAGLIAGVLLPDVAQMLTPWLPHLVVLLLFLTALRIGPATAMQGLKGFAATLRTILVLQLVLPLSVLGVAMAAGVSNTPHVMAVVLVLAAPALSGSPNLSIMLGASPEPAFRLLVLGTALLPLTMLPVFWLLPQLGGFATGLNGAGRAVVAIGVAVACGFWIRANWLGPATIAQTHRIDAAMTLALVIIVVGLMAAVRPALQASWLTFIGWLALACTLNFGMQILSFAVLKRYGTRAEVVPFSIISGTRNVAIFLVTLPPATAQPLLLFLGCYQVPMYLTPILMRRLYASHRAL